MATQTRVHQMPWFFQKVFALQICANCQWKQFVSPRKMSGIVPSLNSISLHHLLGRRWWGGQACGGGACCFEERCRAGPEAMLQNTVKFRCKCAPAICLPAESKSSEPLAGSGF